MSNEYNRLTFDGLMAVVGQGVINLDTGLPVEPHSHVHGALAELVKRVAAFRIVDNRGLVRGQRTVCSTCGTSTPVHTVGVVEVAPDGTRSPAKVITRVVSVNKGERCVRYRGTLYEVSSPKGNGRHVIVIPTGGGAR